LERFLNILDEGVYVLDSGVRRVGQIIGDVGMLISEALIDAQDTLRESRSKPVPVSNRAKKAR